MGTTYLLTLILFAVIIAAGVAVSVRLYNRGVFKTARIRRIRRVRGQPGGQVIEEIIEEETPPPPPTVEEEV